MGEWLWVICEGLRERDVQVVERVRLEVPDGLGEEAGADEEEEVGHDDHEDRQRCREGAVSPICGKQRQWRRYALVLLANA